MFGNNREKLKQELKELCPLIPDERLDEALDRLTRFVALIARMSERLAREENERRKSSTDGV